MQRQQNSASTYNLQFICLVFIILLLFYNRILLMVVVGGGAAVGKVYELKALAVNINLKFLLQC